MSAMKDAYTAALGKLHDLWAALEAEGHHLAGDAKSVLDELKGDAPKLEAEAAADAADVVHTAETQGLTPAAEEAAADAEQLGADAVHDVEAALTPAPKSEAPVETATPAAGA